METFEQIIADLEAKLAKTKSVSEKVSEQSEYAIGHCRIALNNMREHVIRYGFPDKQSEIYFFKNFKPKVYSKLLFHQAVFDLEINKNEADSNGLEAYYRKELDKISDFMDQNKVKVQYYRCNFKYMDEKYFLRDAPEIPVQLKKNHVLMDEKFFTWHDHTFSTIMAYDMLVGYILEEISKLKAPVTQSNVLVYSGMTWTGDHTNVVELIYALKESRMINDGNVSLKQLARWFEMGFNIDLKDFYHTWQEIKRRKVERTKFLDLLREILRRLMDDSDS